MTSMCRRTLLRGVAVAGGAAALTGCAGAGGSGGGRPADVPAGADLVALADVPVGGAVTVETEGRTLVVARPAESEAVAFSAVCTHQGCIVEAEDDALACPCHGSRFGLLTGEVRSGPADAPLPPVAVQVVDGRVRTA